MGLWQSFRAEFPKARFGPDYDRTLMEWHRRFVAAWPELRSAYGERFFRMWSFYLLKFAGGFLFVSAP